MTYYLLRYKLAEASSDVTGRNMKCIKESLAALMHYAANQSCCCCHDNSGFKDHFSYQLWSSS